ncbi:MAG TPA: VCBS repeat-containing protein [Kofleriaceae bacterium]|jgi:hypothetical protein|nr:VCBS repeat-containing protein [Kofleriaceae bacterium]
MRSGYGIVLLGCAVAACRDLPELPIGTCGNGVVELGEDCDGAINPAIGDNLSCASADESAACRYTCAAASCPTGWACGDDGVCRYATGELTLGPAIPWTHDDLAIADLDGDRIGEIVAFDSRGVRVMFADRTTLAASPDQLTGSSVVDDLDGDGRADVVAPIMLGLAIARGDVDRTVTPVSYSQFRAAPGAWFLPVRVPLAGEADAVAVVAGRPNGVGSDAALYLVPSGAMQQSSLLSSTLPPSSFGPNAVRADLDAPSAEDELIVSAPGQQQAWLLAPTSVGSLLQIVPRAIALGTVGDGRLLATDLDGDGDLDVLAGTIATPGIVAIVNTAGTLGSAAPYAGFSALAQPSAIPEVPSAPQPFPLAVADLDDDGDLDAVSPDAVFMQGATLEPSYRRTTTAPWREAVITDVDRDGRRDVIVASTLGVEVLRNRPTGFSRVAIDTAGPASQLRTGDFDADGLGDIAFREHAERDRVRILFGAIGAFSSPVAAIGLPAIHRVEVGRFGVSGSAPDPEEDLVIVGWDGQRPGISFVTGSGDRRLRSVLTLASGSTSDRPLDVVAGHFISDGLDLAVLAVDQQGDRRLWLFAASPELAYHSDEAAIVSALDALESLAVRRLVAADLDGDGRDELVVLGRSASGNTQLVIAYLQGAPKFTVIEPAIGDPVDIVAGDVDRDGASELFISGTTGFMRFRGNELAPLPYERSSVCLAQLDADPGLELALATEGVVTILDGTTLAPQGTLAIPGAAVVRAGDLDGDGVADLVVGDHLSIMRVHSTPQVPQ